jgi:cell division protein FtsB
MESSMSRDRHSDNPTPGNPKAKLIRQLRQHLSSSIGLEDAPPPMIESVDQLHDDRDDDLIALRQRANIYHVPLFSAHRFGRAITATRRLARKVLKPILMFQVAYNGANARFAEVLTGRVAQLRQEVNELQDLARDRAETIAHLEAEIEALKTQQKLQNRAIQKLIRTTNKES